MAEIDPENPFDPSTHDGDGDGEEIPMRPTSSRETPLNPFQVTTILTILKKHHLVVIQKQIHYYLILQERV